MDDKQSILDSLMRQGRVVGIDPSANCRTENIKWQGYFDSEADISITSKGMSEGLRELDLRTDLRIDELSTIRKLLERCTIDATRCEVMHVLEAACTHPEECIDCPYKNSLGECNRNERIADILLNRFGRVK